MNYLQGIHKNTNRPTVSTVTAALDCFLSFSPYCAVVYVVGSPRSHVAPPCDVATLDLAMLSNHLVARRH